MALFGLTKEERKKVDEEIAKASQYQNAKTQTAAQKKLAETNAQLQKAYEDSLYSQMNDAQIAAKRQAEQQKKQASNSAAKSTTTTTKTTTTTTSPKAEIKAAQNNNKVTTYTGANPYNDQMVTLTSGMTSDPVTGQIKYYPENKTVVEDKKPPTNGNNKAPAAEPTPVYEAPQQAVQTTQAPADNNLTIVSGTSKQVAQQPRVYTVADYYQPVTAKFTPSAEYTAAMNNVTSLLNQLREGRTSYTDKINAKLQAIEDTPAFSYDFNTDPLFQSQLAASMNSGKLAMEDTMGQAAALTGGYGSTYGQAVGNAQYNNFIKDAYNNLPQYWNMAFKTYESDLDNKYRLLDQYRQSDNTEYGRLSDAYERETGYANDMYNKEYNNYWQEQNFNEDSRRWAADFNEANRQWAAQFNEGVYEYDTDDAFRRERANVSDDQWNQTFDYQKYRDSVDDSHWLSNYNLSAYKASNSGSGAGTSGKQTAVSGADAEVTYKDPSSTELQKALKAYNEGGENALYEYVDTLASNINVERIMAYINQYGVTPYMQRNWENVKDTTNWFGGLDNNDIVRDPRTGEEYKLSDLAKLIAEQEGITEKEARKWLEQYNGKKAFIS